MAPRLHPWSSLAAMTALTACGSQGGERPTIPADVIGPPAGEAPGELVDRGELILRSRGEETGRETFTMRRRGDELRVEATARYGWPDEMTARLDLVVDPASWRVARFDLDIDRAGEWCGVRRRAAGEVVEVTVVYADGSGRVVDREPRERAEHFVSMRPVLTQTAVCARADDQPHELQSFAPWYVVRAAPRAPSTIARAGGGTLDLVRVDELIDVYCDGPRLALVHYPAHALIAARSEYDDEARRLTADDPTDRPWTGALACPPR